MSWTEDEHSSAIEVRTAAFASVRSISVALNTPLEITADLLKLSKCVQQNKMHAKCVLSNKHGEMHAFLFHPCLRKNKHNIMARSCAVSCYCSDLLLKWIRPFGVLLAA